MFYDLDIKKDDDFVYASVSGMRTRKVIASAIKEIGEFCRKYQIDQAIIDVRKLTGRIPIFDSLSLIFDDFTPIRKSMAVRKVAVIETEIRRVRFSFFERVARKYGYNIRVFTDPDAAVQWICDSGDTDPPDKRQ